MTDYEKSMRLAINSFYPNAKLHGCWFHFDQAIGRYCKKNLQIRRILSNNANARNIFQQLLSLPLLPEDKFTEGYEAIKSKARMWRVYFQLLPMFRYFTNYWVKQVS